MKGFIRERSKGRYEITVDKGSNPETGKRLRHFETVKGRKSDAQKRLHELLYTIEKGTYIEPTRLTVAQFLKDWLQDYVAIQTAPKTQERYEEIIRLHLIPALGSVLVSSLRPPQIQKYCTYAYKSGRRDGKGGLAPSTVHKHYGILFEALKYGVKHGILTRNPAESVDPPPSRLKAPVIPSAQDVQLIIDKASGTPYLTLFYTGAYTGLRRGELLGLRWCDVDLNEATISVIQTLQQLRSRKYIFKKPKSKHGQRQIDLSPSLVFQLWDHKIRQEQQKKLLGITLSPTDLVFSRPDGRPLRPNSVSRAFQNIARSLSLQNFSLHSLRHAHATIMLQQGVHPKIVQERLGHSSISTTLDIYSHVVPGLQKAAAQRFDDGLPNTSLKESDRTVAQNIVGRMSAIMEILPLEEVLG